MDKYFDTSAKTGENFKNHFIEAAKIIHENDIRNNYKPDNNEIALKENEIKKDNEKSEKMEKRENKVIDKEEEEKEERGKRRRRRRRRRRGRSRK